MKNYAAVTWNNFWADDALACASMPSSHRGRTVVDPGGAMSCQRAHSHYGTKEQSNSILRLADWIVANGMDGPGEFRTARGLLLRHPPPRFSAGQSLAAGANETTVDRARRLAVALDHSVLALQGPPGAGKTFTGTRMICELVNHGKKVGITAVGHKVIGKLLDEVLNAAQEMNVVGVTCGHKISEDGSAGGPVREIQKNDEAPQAAWLRRIPLPLRSYAHAEALRYFVHCSGLAGTLVGKVRLNVAWEEDV